ncbi:MnuA family membrane nuclease [Mycoplasmopsis columbinasalis]|uniref:Membrane nuclease MnuA n=1 Tax=Mycoplasmopsis columbinasalis TaxID=114880 RepID=A0A449BA85_9BACT|nr:hypothetical protein [Mycoplasmopsis columbinasalis]VEU78102.1 Membrane nuclease MnuA [Mycoplasmopsis columbinasalis]
MKLKTKLVLSCAGIASFLPLLSATSCTEKISDAAQDILKKITNIPDNTANNTQKQNEQKSIFSGDKIQIMSWNIENFGGTNDNALSNKVYGLAGTIFHVSPDIVAIQEINSNSGDKLQRITDLLNNFEKERSDNKTKNSWTFVTSETIKNPNFPNSIEDFGFIYKENVVSVVQKDGQEVKKLLTNYDFTRYPFLVDFQVNGKDDVLSLVTFHLDSPGNSASKNEQASKQYNGQGEQEVKEALMFPKIILDLKNAGVTNDIILLGDTNIMAENQALFETQEFIQNNIKTAYREFAQNVNEHYKSSLRQTATYKKSGKSAGYSQPYDKFVYLDQGAENIAPVAPEQYRVDLLKAYDTQGGWLDLKTGQQKWWNIYSKNTSYVNKNSVPWYELVTNISDHAPVLLDYYLTKTTS